MQNLLRIEWLKVRSYKAFWFLLGFSVLGIVGLSYIVYSIKVSVDTKAGKENGAMLIGHPFSYPDVWQAISYVSGFMLFLPGLLIITLISNEFTYRTHRQNIIDGWTRTQMIGVKWMWVFILSLVATLTVILASVLLGMTGDTPFSLDKFYYVGCFFVEALNYMAVALLLGVLIKRAGLAISFFILYLLIVKNLLSWGVDKLNNSHIGNFLPLTISDKLITFPVTKSLGALFITPGPAAGVLLAGSIVYLGLYAWLMIWKFNNQDL